MPWCELAALVNVFDPKAVVIGGGTGRERRCSDRHLRDAAQFEWRPGGARARIVPAQLGDRAGAFGAAYNAIHFQT